MITEFQLQQMLARTEKSRIASQPITGEPETKESDLHDKISSYCRAKGWIAFHGSMAHRTFRSLGEPDFILMCGNGRVYFIEAKTRTGKLSPEQLGLKLMAERLGHVIHVVRSFSDFLNVIQPTPESASPPATPAKSH